MSWLRGGSNTKFLIGTGRNSETYLQFFEINVGAETLNYSHIYYNGIPFRDLVYVSLDHVLSVRSNWPSEYADDYYYTYMIIVRPLKFENHILMVNTTYSTSGESYFMFKHIPAEYVGVSCERYYEHFASSSETSSFRGSTSGSLKQITGSNRQRSTVISNYPTSNEDMDTWYGS